MERGPNKPVSTADPIYRCRAKWLWWPAYILIWLLLVLVKWVLFQYCFIGKMKVLPQSNWKVKTKCLKSCFSFFVVVLFLREGGGWASFFLFRLSPRVLELVSCRESTPRREERAREIAAIPARDTEGENKGGEQKMGQSAETKKCWQDVCVCG